MPIPFIIGAIALAAGAIGVGAAASGISDMSEAKTRINSARASYEKCKDKFQRTEEEVTNDTEKLGKFEAEICADFKYFIELNEKLENKPEFAKRTKNGVKIPELNVEELKLVSALGIQLLATSESLALGTFTGLAASGVTTTLVAAVGAASTGTSISTLSGAALTNATLAWLGGGSLAVGGGGMALGTAVLGGATLGVGLLVGGLVYAYQGDKLLKQARDTEREADRAIEQLEKACSFLLDLGATANIYYITLDKVKNIYQSNFKQLEEIAQQREYDCAFFTDDEVLVYQNTVDLVSLLFHMCNVQLMLKNSEDEKACPIINKQDGRDEEGNVKYKEGEQGEQEIAEPGILDEVERAKDVLKKISNSQDLLSRS